MSSSNSSFYSGTIFGLVLGIVCGHFFIWKDDSSEATVLRETFSHVETAPAEIDYELGRKSASLPYFTESELTPVSEYPEPELSAILEDESEYVSPLANAIAVEEVADNTEQAPADEPAVVEIEVAAEEPKPLDIDDAAPIEAIDRANEARIREAIKKELPDVPKAQRDIWFDSLKDMHVDDVTGVIRMWKMIGGPIPGLGEDVFPLLSDPAKPTAIVAPENPDGSQTSTAIMKAIEIHRKNLLMKSTFGYRRSIPRFIEQLQNDGTKVITSVTEQVDFQHGGSVQTNNLFDLIIEGSGLFLLKDEEGKEFCTRRGQFSLNDQRQLTLFDQEDEYVLQPSVKIPEQAAGVIIDRDGTLTCQDRNGNDIGTPQGIQLLRITQTHQLQYFKNGLFQPSAAKPLILITPGQLGGGSIFQGRLETSNVNVEEELEQIDLLKELLDHTPPKTAIDPLPVY